ncbi:non-ribosomal peptide synthetase, partial [Paenibacillus silvestris]|uniref:non-ribosomal peptide synthetase n=1 Tax=Paenibacillus silvestris TaxID=2606219 RepID=UPI0013733192
WITSLSFDLSVYDIFGVLAAGGSVVVAQRDAVRDPQELKRLLVAGRITLWDSVPTTMSYLVQSIENSPEEAPWQQTDLRLVLVSGDWIPVNLKARMSGVFPQAQLIGLGGATEATVWSNYYPIHAVSEEQRSIPYGKPLANNVFYILDPFGLPVPSGVRGELFIGGVGVARGYAGDRDKTEQAFVPNPFRPDESMYRTGDLGRLLPDGNMEFLGRKDHQVKVRGFRVELGEIEYWLRQHADIEEAVVLCIDSGGREQLCAYVVPTRDVEAAEVREHLAKHLPAYMLPSHLLCIPALPLTANGKIDRKALPAPESVHRGAVQEPQSEVEKKLAAIWQEVLGVKQISVDDDFFLLGGHSLLAATLVARLAAETGVELPLPFIFRYPTVGQLAERIEEMQLFRGEADTPVTLLQKGREGTIFCFPPVGGYGFVYKGLASQLPSYSWYAFDFITDPDRLQAYVKWITELQAEGPYVLLGYSAGGNLAYEVGKLLEDQGHVVSDIVILDALFRDQAISQTMEEIEQETEQLLGMLETTELGLFLRTPSIRKEAAHRMREYRIYLSNLVNQGPLTSTVYAVESEELLTSATWEGSTSGRVLKYKGTGTHIEFLDERNLPENAALVQRILQGCFPGATVVR